MPKVGRGNNFWNIFNELNHGCIISLTTKRWWVVDWITLETGKRYEPIEFVQLSICLSINGKGIQIQYIQTQKKNYWDK